MVVTIVLVMLWVVPPRRDPESATAWLLFSFFLPYLAVLAFALIGTSNFDVRSFSLDLEIVRWRMIAPWCRHSRPGRRATGAIAVRGAECRHRPGNGEYPVGSRAVLARHRPCVTRI